MSMFANILLDSISPEGIRFTFIIGGLSMPS